MANNSQHTSSTHSQNLQYNNISMSIQPQNQLKDKIQQNAMDEKKQKKVFQNGHKRKLMENERDKQKAELESSKSELKNLLSQYGTKAKVADDLERDTTKLRGSIESLLARVQSNKFNK
ncbi:19286_t:CDS:2, partial [Gigaspora rosea]